MFQKRAARPEHGEEILEAVEADDLEAVAASAIFKQLRLNNMAGARQCIQKYVQKVLLASATHAVLPDKIVQLLDDKLPDDG